MTPAHYPSLYQINTRVWLTEIGRNLGRRATLDDVPDAELDRPAATGFDFLWLMSVWQTGAAGLKISRTNPAWRTEFADVLADLSDDDIGGSGFAIASYNVHTALCGDAGLARLRERMRKRGLRLVLDFVPNHTAIDHRWVEEHPDYYIRGTEADFARAPQNYTRLKGQNEDLLLALGRDPLYPAWPDVLQLNYGNPALQEAMIGQLTKIAGQCDGVRCDMAMLLLPEVFERTWGVRAEPFWPKAIAAVRQQHPDFRFMAEVYWDLEWTLQQQGFDYTYDKRLYDRLRAGRARPVREHLLAGLDYQAKLMRFMENHDEPRAAMAFSPEMHKAAAVVTYFTPGLRFFQQGQFEGRKKRIPSHLIRAPNEPLDATIQSFYDRLLAILREPIVREGRWQLLECTPAWEGNWTNDCFIAFAWQNDNGDRLLVTVNYAASQSQCFVRLPFGDLSGRQWRLQDRLSDAVYDRDGNDLESIGLYLDVPPWRSHVFSLSAIG